MHLSSIDIPGLEAVTVSEGSCFSWIMYLTYFMAESRLLCRTELPKHAFAVPHKAGQRRKGLQAEADIEKILSQAQRRSLPAN